MKNALIIGLLSLARVASAQLTCNGAFELSYPGIGPFVDVGDTVAMRVAYGAGPILGGSALFVNNFAVELACDSAFPVIPCVAEAGKISYDGDATIVSNCVTCVNVAGGLPGVPTPCVWTSNNPGGGAVPNDVLFQLPPNVLLRVPELAPVGFCGVSFTVTKLAESADTTPNLIEQNAGYIPSPIASCPNCLAVCDNFVLASQVVQSSALLGAPANSAFQCYEAPRRDTHKPAVTVTVTDTFGSDTVRALRIHDFCAPTDLNGLDPLAPQNPVHNAGYVLDGVDGTKFANPTVTAVSTFGSFTFRVGNPTTLFVPTAKSVVPAAPPAPLVGANNHYLCHRISQIQGPSVKGLGFTGNDQFSDPNPISSKLSIPNWLCAPAQKNAEPIVDPAAFLLCFGTNTPQGTPLGVEANIENQFGTAKIDLTQRLGLCVAATVQ